MKRAAFVILTAIAVPLPAQIEEDPRVRVQEILDDVADEMRQIDSLFRQTSRAKPIVLDLHKAENRTKLLDSVGKSQKRVIQGIDDLLEQARKMNRKGGGC